MGTFIHQWLSWIGPLVTNHRELAFSNQVLQRLTGDRANFNCGRTRVKVSTYYPVPCVNCVVRLIVTALNFKSTKIRHLPPRGPVIAVC